MEDTSCTQITQLGSTWQKLEILFFTSSSSGVLLLHIICNRTLQYDPKILIAFVRLIVYIILKSRSKSIHNNNQLMFWRYLSENITRSGESPSPLSSRTLACVGLVFCSPVVFGWNTRSKVSKRTEKNYSSYFIVPKHGAPTCGTRLTWTQQKCSRFTLNWNCLKASTNGIPSMSPMVPPSWKTIIYTDIITEYWGIVS